MAQAPQTPALLTIGVPEKVNKKAIAELADALVTQWTGERMELRAAEGLSVLEKLIKVIREDERFRYAVVDEVTLYNGKYKTPNGTLIETMEAGVKYDYSHDEEWRGLDAEIKRLTEARKAREAVLKIARDGQQAVDEATGELVTGANRSSKTTFKVTLAKF